MDKRCWDECLEEDKKTYCNVLPVFDFKISNYVLNLIKRCLLHLLVNESELEPTVIKEPNLFVAFNFGDVQLLDILNFFWIDEPALILA